MASELHVDAIKHSGGTSALTIDSSGRVLKSTIPSFHAVRTSNQTSAGVGAFDTATLNEGSHYNTSNYRFTAPVAGLYYFTCSWVPYTTSNGEGNYFRKNGSQVGQKTYVINSDQQITNSHIFQLSASDYVDVYFIANGCEYVYSHFSGYLIG